MVKKPNTIIKCLKFLNLNFTLQFKYLKMIYLINYQNLKSSEREDRSYELLGAIYKLAEQNKSIVDKINEDYEGPEITDTEE